jgi:CDP-ribitol ribitolphosphotransferase
MIPVNPVKILLIMTHDDSDEGNVGSTYRYFQKRNPELIFKIVRREDYTFEKNKNLLKKLYKMFLLVPYHTATSSIIFMDNVFLPFSAIKIKKDTNLVQLWHGTGSIKKFGLECEEGWIKKLAIKTNKNTTHFIVGSRWMKNIYKASFGANDNRIWNIGCPRTDIFFNEDIILKMRDDFFNNYPELFGKKIILYAPTFRDDVTEIKIHLEIDELMRGLDENYVLCLRLHPHISNIVKLDKLFSEGGYHNRIFDFSNYDKLNTLLLCSDLLITDYSSIIYEYALLKKPMIFYPYDLEIFRKKGRGFYGNYANLVPGPVALKTDDIVNLINNSVNYNLDEFLSVYLENCDGNSRKRLYDLLME